ncbi:UNVERIFIED_CONTAM: hypothetical protein RMT77_008666 [Armadillidium vulgare]
MASSPFVHTALRTFEHELAPILKGISIAKIAPILIVVFIAFIIFKIFLDGADSKYSPYARSLALTAANLWDARNELGFSPTIRGRTLASMEPLTEVLDALSNSVRKYEFEPSINALPNSYSASKVRFE